MKKSMVGGVPGNVLGMYADLSLKLKSGSITVEELALFLKRQNPFAITDIHQEWQEFYRKDVDFRANFSDVVIPENPGGFDRAIFIPKGLTFASVVKALRKKTSMCLYTENLDENVTENVRIADHNYAIRIRKRQEADVELKNLSANRLKERGVDCITLLERLVLELKYYSETGQHLDIDNVTLCAGSRDSDGYVPDVSWFSFDGKLYVYWYYSDFASDVLRARQVVSK